MENIKLNVQNIRCNGCVNSISQKLKSITGIKEVHVDIENEIVEIEGDNTLNLQEAKNVLFQLGYPEKSEKNSLYTKIKSVKSCAIGKIN